MVSHSNGRARHSKSSSTNWNTVFGFIGCVLWFLFMIANFAVCIVTKNERPDTWGLMLAYSIIGIFFIMSMITCIGGDDAMICPMLIGSGEMLISFVIAIHVKNMSHYVIYAKIISCVHAGICCALILFLIAFTLHFTCLSNCRCGYSRQIDENPTKPSQGTDEVIEI